MKTTRIPVEIICEISPAGDVGFYINGVTVRSLDTIMAVVCVDYKDQIEELRAEREQL